MRDELLRELANIEERLSSLSIAVSGDDDAFACALIARAGVSRALKYLSARNPRAAARADMGIPEPQPEPKPEPKKRGRKPKQTSLLEGTAAPANGTQSNVARLGDMPPREAS